MGNQMSVPQKLEDQEDGSETVANKVASENEYVPNGVSVTLSTRTVQHYDEVDLGISIPEDNAAASSPKTMEISSGVEASGKNLGKEAKAKAPAAKSRFFLTLSRPVPGRAGDQATDSSPGSVQLDVGCTEAAGNKAPSENMALPAAAAAGDSPDKTPGPTPAEDGAASASWGPEPVAPESGEAAPSKPRDAASFFDRLFKLDKGREKTPVGSQAETQRAEHQEVAAETAGLSRPSNDVPAEQDLADSQEEEEAIATLSSSIPEAPEELEIAQDNPQITNTTENNSIMSFFKTLVSPQKAETKKDPEDPDTDRSPPAAADPKSDKANFIPQETQRAAKQPKGSNPPGQVPSAATAESTKEGVKEKAGPTSSPLGRLFWKKSIKEDSVPTGSEENVVCESPAGITKSQEAEPDLQTVDLNKDGDAVSEPTEVTLQREESKPPRTSLMAFFRQMSVKREVGDTHSEEINGKDANYQTSDSPEKATKLPEPEPAAAGQKGKEGSLKDKKTPAEMTKQKSNKQEAKEPALHVEQCAVEANSPQSMDKPPRRPERRRPSLGDFLRGLGPKRMLDAQVQTDPVSIGPAGKSK